MQSWKGWSWTGQLLANNRARWPKWSWNDLLKLRNRLVESVWWFWPVARSHSCPLERVRWLSLCVEDAEEHERLRELKDQGRACAVHSPILSRRIGFLRTAPLVGVSSSSWNDNSSFGKKPKPIKQSSSNLGTTVGDSSWAIPCSDMHRPQ